MRKIKKRLNEVNWKNVLIGVLLVLIGFIAGSFVAFRFTLKELSKIL